jgi:polyphosphate kinase
VILMTKIWRELHERKGWPLMEAAKLVGISKKSLDDYFLVLRVGVIHGYDYAGNLSEGMGELRSFIKTK